MVTGAFPIAAPLASVTVPIMFPETAWPMTLGWDRTKIPRITTRRGNNSFIGTLIAGQEPEVIEHRNSNESIKLLEIEATQVEVAASGHRAIGIGRRLIYVWIDVQVAAHVAAISGLQGQEIGRAHV